MSSAIVSTGSALFVVPTYGKEESNWYSQTEEVNYLLLIGSQASSVTNACMYSNGRKQTVDYSMYFRG